MQKLACALAIGGVDPGGGAGLAADLRAFAEAGVFGCAVVAVLTVQSTAGLRAVRVLATRDVVAQAREVLAHQRVRAIKTGALGSAGNVRAVAELAGSVAETPLVVDTVLAPTRGRLRLHDDAAKRALRTYLLPRAAVVTANAAEASELAGKRLHDARDAAAAAAELQRVTGARAVLVKGGHLRDREAVDVLALAGGRTVALAARRLTLRRPLHGAGCVLASLIAGGLARGGEGVGSSPTATEETILAAVRWAKRRHHALLVQAADVGGPLAVLPGRRR
jgi:hydroxymethylpyrimidine/phosphomethylpyrimidine kinase